VNTYPTEVNTGSGDLNTLGKEFRLLHLACPALRADWDHIIGSGISGEWRRAGAEPGATIQFEALARRAASVAPDAGVPDLLNAWLDALRGEGINFEFGREGIEQNADGSEGARHLTGTIWRVCEASAMYCGVLESRALEAEFRATRQGARQPGEAKAAEIAQSGAADTAAQEHVEQAAPSTEQTVVSASEPAPATTESRRSVVDDFLVRCNQESAGFKVLRKHIWLATGHKHSRQFHHWQNNSARATAGDDRNFRRILGMPTPEFMALLKKKGIPPPQA
jgi:hypothetical protein